MSKLPYHLIETGCLGPTTAVEKKVVKHVSPVFLHMNGYSAGMTKVAEYTAPDRFDCQQIQQLHRKQSCLQFVAPTF